MRQKKFLLLSLVVMGIFLIVTTAAYAFSAAQEEQAFEKGLFLIGAGLGAGLACFGAAIGMGTASAAAIGAIAEKPEVFGRTLLYIVFIEAIAIYGLVIFFMIYMKL
jgi:V/A-type H+-transporting ATPase subunit K